jgi:hypothetical protein
MIDKCYFPVLFVYKYPWLIAVLVSALLILIRVTFRLYELTLKTIKKYFVSVWLQTRRDDVFCGGFRLNSPHLCGWVVPGGSGGCLELR